MLLLWVVRFFIFHLYESPKYLMGRGRDAEAVEVVHKVAAYNGTTSKLTVEMLRDAGQLSGVDQEDSAAFDTGAKAAVLRKLSSLNGSHVRPLFATRKLAYSTTLLIILWGEYPDCMVPFSPEIDVFLQR